MLKSVMFFGGIVCLAAGCGSLTAYRNQQETLPPNWDSAHDAPPANRGSRARNAPALSTNGWRSVPAPVSIAAAPISLPTNPPANSLALDSTTNAPPNDLALSVTNSDSGPASQALSSEDTWVGLNHWARAHGLEPAERVLLPPLELTVTNGYPWRNFSLKARTSVNPLPAFLLHTTNGELVIQPETRTAHWDDVEIHLGFPPGLVQGEVVVHSEDLSHTLEPLLHSPPLPPSGKRTIVIDPDDGDNGQNVPRDLRGKNFALDWAQRLAPLLATNGWTVFLTHTDAVFVPRARRAAFADLHQPQLFLNLRFGLKCLGDDQSGLVTCCLVPASLPSAESPSSFDESWHPYPNNEFDAENLEYAFRLHHALNDVPDITDRGVRRTRFIDILQDRNCPAVCISGGSLADPHDAALIATPIFRQKLAEAVASALSAR